MAVVENLLNEHFIVDDFKSWLISNNVDNLNDKTNFITNFLIYIKEKCAWIISKDGKNVETSPFKSSGKSSSVLTIEKNVNVSKSPKKNSERLPVNNQIKDKHIDEAKYCSKGFNKFEDTRTNVHGYNKSFSSNNQHKYRYDEKNSVKPHSSAKKTLNFYSAKDAKSDILHSKTEQVFDINVNSLDAFPPLGEQGSANKPYVRKGQRRITPTPVQSFHKGTSNFGTSIFNVPPEKVPNEVFNRSSVVERHSSDLQNERDMLKKTRNELSNVMTNNFNDLKIENVSPIKRCANYIDPNPEEVSYKNQLEIFSTVYDILITNAFVPNVTSELYFIFELLTSKVSAEDKPVDKDSIFCSIHNVIYFGVSVLTKIQNLLHLLDQTTLSSLCEIPFLSKFSVPLVNFLQECSNINPESAHLQQTLNRVPFLQEEDSRENFSDGKAFTDFRKQRDLFYELLREWQQQPLNSMDQKYQESFSRKAKLLINLGPNTVNLYHLARLFQNQLIASCLGLEVNEAYDEFLSNIQQNFPSKFKKLYQRFMMPFCAGEPSPPPAFYGIQAFFCELIQAASSSSLNQQLQDIFISKILELNNADIFSEGELSSLTTVKEKYIFVLHTLRLLGKFLGYLYFLPYKVSEPLPTSFLNNQLSSRKKLAPPLDILKLLKIAVENNRVILTVPWIVEYLSMIDSVGVKLPYVEETLSILVSIYQGKYILSPKSLNFWFLRIMIGWLFDVLNFSAGYYSLFHSQTLGKNLKSEVLDTLAVIDKQLIHSCCPYLNEFKVLVCNFLNGIKNNKKREVRKITPLSTTKPQLSASQKSHQIEAQLEENFFFLHPPSMKKTVEFIAERIASKIINKIRSEVTDFKLQTIDYITKNEAYKTLSSNSTNGNKIKAFVDSCILTQYEKSQSKIANIIHIDSLKAIEHVMPYFFPDDLKHEILNVCCKISFRLAVDKITDWCDTNLIFVDISKDIKNKLNHLSKGEEENTANIDISLFKIISKLRRFTVKILSGSDTLLDDHLMILSEIITVMHYQFGSATKKLIVYLTMDLFIAVVIHDPEKLSDCLNEKLLHIWSLCPKNFGLENYFLGVQNIKFLLAAKNFDFSCKLYSQMFLNLLSNKIFDAKNLDSYFVNLQSFHWGHPRANEILCLLSDTLNKTAASKVTK